MRFDEPPLFWVARTLPDRGIVDHDELMLVATGEGDIATARVYRFERVKEANK